LLEFCDFCLDSGLVCLTNGVWSLDSSWRGYCCEILIVGGLVGIFK
jgi:hypothetical protein